MKMSDISVKAVALGLLIDIVGSICVGIALVFVITIIGISSGADIEGLRQNVVIKIIGLLGTTFCTVLGGYVATRIAKANSLASSLAVGVLSLLLGVLTVAAFPGVSPRWKIAIGVIVTIPAALLGGYAAVRRTAQASLA